jgi:hypothetical protein
MRLKLATRGSAIRVGVVLVLLALLAWCWGRPMIVMPGKSHRGPLPELTEAERALSAELRAYVATLCTDIGERNYVEYRGLRRAADWIESAMADAGYAVEWQPVSVPDFAMDAARMNADGQEPVFVNLIGQRTGTELPDEIVVVGAHYDSVAVPGCVGADDNASAVAGLLALARRFATRSTRRTIRFVAFVNEEPPFFQSDGMGSLAYAQRCRERDEDIVGMLCLEMIGYYTDAAGSQQYPLPFSLFYPDTGNFIAFVANPASRTLLRRVIGTFRETTRFPSEGAAVPGWIPGVSFSDHWSFWRNDYPAVMVTDTAMFRYPWYHTAHDNPEWLDYDRMARVTTGLVHVVTQLADE